MNTKDAGIPLAVAVIGLIYAVALSAAGTDRPATRPLPPALHDTDHRGAPDCHHRKLAAVPSPDKPAHVYLLWTRDRSTAPTQPGVQTLF